MGRFFQGFDWRFLFTNIPTPNTTPARAGGITTTWANGLLTNRQVSYTLNAPTVISAAVWPDDRRVNTIFPLDNDPLVAQSNRIIYAFRREAPGNIGSDIQDPWVCRAAGVLMSPEDQGDTDIPLSHLVAYDAWETMNGRICFKSDGTLPDDGGIPSWTLGGTGDQIALNMLLNTIVWDKSGPLGSGFCFIDAGVAWGGTAFYGGTLETTAEIAYQVQQGQMVGQVWTDLCDAGNMDIVLKPIYDTRRPGYTHELNIYSLAGSDRPSAVFAWGKLMRSLNTADRMHDGTPGNFVDRVLYFAGQGGPPSLVQTNDAALAKYLAAWVSQAFPSQTDIIGGTAVLELAKQALRLGKQGRRTMTVGATPERSPIPLRDYMPGDRVPLYTSESLRVSSTGYQRVESIPITITDDGIEQVQALLCSPDWRDGS